MKSFISATALLFLASSAHATVLQYGDKDVVGTGTYTSDPVSGATLEGLAPGFSTVGIFGTTGFSHSFPFSPEVGEFAGTDQIYVGSSQTASHDGYSTYAERLSAPHTIVLDYSSIVPTGHTIDTLTLGVGFDDFQFPNFGQAFSLEVNGTLDPALTSLANSLDQTGPRTTFATIGIAPTELVPSHIVTLTIDQTGTGGDGWAVDFLTIGVTTSIPEPSTLALFGLALTGLTSMATRHAK